MIFSGLLLKQKPLPDCSCYDVIAMKKGEILLDDVVSRLIYLPLPK
jgi:hypothetical protein